MNYKVCSKCKRRLEATEENFTKHPTCKFGFHSSCKICVAKYYKQYCQDHREKVSKYNKKYYQNNKEELSRKKAEQYQNKKEAFSKYNKKYYQEHKEEISIKNKQRYREREGESTNDSKFSRTYL